MNNGNCGPKNYFGHEWQFSAITLQFRGCRFVPDFENFEITTKFQFILTILVYPSSSQKHIDNQHLLEQNSACQNILSVLKGSQFDKKLSLFVFVLVCLNQYSIHVLHVQYLCFVVLLCLVVNFHFHVATMAIRKRTHFLPFCKQILNNLTSKLK